ncbi:MAG: hypothetical protein MPL62_01730 [Alphaproteobacteria bacterium]|nr:hypothetical protein [Alphaproteobacteria bacterium]
MRRTTETAPPSAAFVSLIKGTNDDHHGNGSIGDKPLALVGVGLRQSRRWLKRAMPTYACGRCPQKNKWTTSQFLVRPFIVRLLKFNFLQAAPAGVSGCRSLERLSRPVQSPRPLMPKACPAGPFKGARK